MSEPVKMIPQDQFLPRQEKVDVTSVEEDDASLPVQVWDDRFFLIILFRQCWRENPANFNSLL